MFEKKALFKASKANVADLENLELELIDFGLDDFTADDEFVYIYTPFQDFGSMQKALEDRNMDIAATEFQFIPNNYKEVTEEQRKEVNELIEALEDDDDVQSVYNNMQ